MKIEFSTREYLKEHGKQPKGRGWWMFTFEDYLFEATGTLTEAKKKCREFVKAVVSKDYFKTVIVNIEP